MQAAIWSWRNWNDKKLGKEDWRDTWEKPIGETLGEEDWRGGGGGGEEGGEADGSDKISNPHLAGGE